jgi:copper chaperone CopZ
VTKLTSGGHLILSQDVVVLPVEALGRVVSPAAVEAALARTAGVRSVSMNVAAGRIRVAFNPRQVGLADLAAVVCAAGCGLCVSQTMVRARGVAEVVEALRQVAGVVDAAWDREFVVVSYLPSLVHSRAFVAPIRAAGYPVAADALTAPVTSTIHVPAKEAVTLGG